MDVILAMSKTNQFVPSRHAFRKWSRIIINWLLTYDCQTVERRGSETVRYSAKADWHAYPQAYPPIESSRGERPKLVEIIRGRSGI